MQKEGVTIGAVPSTPGFVEVPKTRHDLTLSCDKPGYQTAKAVNGSDFAAWTMGDVALTSTLGLIIDWSSGAIHKYDSEMNVTLQPGDSAPQVAALLPPTSVAVASAPQPIEYQPPPAPVHTAPQPIQPAPQPVAYQPPPAPLPVEHAATGAHRVFGVGVLPVDPNSAAAQSLGLDFGVRVMVVQDGSIAAKSGIVAGDVLVSLDGEPVNQKGDVQRILASRGEGAIVSVHLVRNGAPMDLATQL
jgi:membrane-associated protease RseP (regulator of RpoE activity)